MGIQANNLNKFYGTTQVLHDVSFHCGKGETLVLLGPSGAGKSSLLRLLNLLEMADGGALSIANNNYDFDHQVSEKQGLALRKQVGMVFQQYNLWPHMTVMENLIEAPTKVAGVSKEQATKRSLKKCFLHSNSLIKPMRGRYNYQVVSNSVLLLQEH